MSRSIWTVLPPLLFSLAAQAGEGQDDWVAGRNQTRIGVGAGAIVTPTFVSSNPTFLGGLASFEIDLQFGSRLGLRISPFLGGGVAAGSTDSRLGGVGLRAESVSLGAFLTDVQLRLAFTPTFSGGVGGLLGLAFGQVAQGASLGFWFGPSLTPVAVRLADRHELSAWVGLALLAGQRGVGLGGLLPSIRYAFYF